MIVEPGSDTAELLPTVSLTHSTSSTTSGISEWRVKRRENNLRQVSRCGTQALIVSRSGRSPDNGNSIRVVSIWIVHSLWRLQTDQNLMKME